MLRLDELVALSSDTVPFEKQVFVVLKQTSKSKPNSPIPDIDSIVELFASSRNDTVNAYCHSLLDYSVHFSASFAQFYVLCEMIWLQSNRSGIPITFVPSTCAKYISADKKSIVMNWIEDTPSEDLMLIKNQFKKVLDHGLLRHLKCSEKRRSGTKSKKKSPVLHTGFTTTNCREYRTHRTTQVGHIHPSLISSYLDNASSECMQELGKAIAMQNCLFSESPDCFGLCNASINESSAQEEMRRRYCSFFKLDKLSQNSENYCNLVRNTATTSLINDHIDYHVDEMNDSSDGNSALLSISIGFPRYHYEQFLSDDVRSWLDTHGQKDIIRFCNLNYSRSVCTVALSRPDQQSFQLSQSNDKSFYLKKAVSDALSDTNSITNYASTFELGRGLSFEDISICIKNYNHSVNVLHNKLARGMVGQLYGSCFETMGDGIKTSLQHTLNEIRKTRSPFTYDWKNDCRDSRFGLKNVPITCDPAKTYQGPKISMTAAYDVNRYHSSNMDVFRDIVSNLGMMNKRNKLAFAAFATIQCNGTLPVSELLRHLARDNWSIREQYCGRRYDRCFWRLAIDVSGSYSFKSVGSSREQRFQISNQGRIFEFGRYCDDILDLFARCESNVADNDVEMFPRFCEVLLRLKENVNGMGHIIALKFVQLCSLIGLLPLRFSTYAMVDCGGPAEILSTVSGNPSEYFGDLHAEFESIWGKRFTLSYLENLLCELNRERKNTLPRSSGIPRLAEDLECLHKVEGSFRKAPSKQKDHFCLYSHRGLERCVPTLYRTVLVGGRWKIEAQPVRLVAGSRSVKLVDKFVVECIDDSVLDHLYL